MNPSDPRTALEELIVLALDALEEGGEERLDALLAGHPEEADGVRAALATLELRGLRVGDPPGDTPSFPERLGGYELLRPLGGGGMGVVYLARDPELGREVALKLVRPDQLHFPGARERFGREVRTIARLQHAGIVPLFGVGEDQGVPFYAMELVRGCTLADVVAELRGRRPEELTGADLQRVLARSVVGEDGEEVGRGEESQLFEGSWERVCLRIVREIAEALEYAHRRGVVHRDVKPSNVMLTPAGRVQLFDFGLSSRRGSTRITRTGSPLGSLAYMAPEMLRGEASEDDGRLDVYSLGATLYELLTLELPFSARSEGELRSAVLGGSVPSPARRLNARASWEAEILCQVAMDPDPHRRYATAGAFAQDLTNALESRPLTARPPGALLRGRRWLRRNPVAAAVLFTLVVGPSVLAVQEYRNARVVLAKSEEISRQSEELRAAGEELALKNRALADALDAEAEARGRAEDNFERALEAVDRLLTRIGEEKLAGVPHLEVTRRDLLKDALEFYRELLGRAEADPGVGIETARVAARAADLSARLGNRAEAVALLVQAEGILRELTAGEDSGPALDLLTKVLRRRADLSLLESALEPAEGFLEEAEELAREPTSGGEALRALHERADGLYQRARLQESRGAIAEALASLEGSIAAFEELVARAPDDRAARHDLAQVLDQCSVVLTDNGLAIGNQDAVLERSLVLLRRSAELARQNLAAEPGNPDYRFRLARTTQNKANVLAALERSAEAREATAEAQALLEGLVADHPAVQLYGRDLALCYMNQGTMYSDPGDEASLMLAAPLFERAIELLHEVGAHETSEPRLRMSFAVALHNSAATEALLGGLDEALARFAESEQHLLAAIEMSGGPERFWDQHLALASSKAGALARGGHHDEAFEAALSCCALGRPIAHLVGATRVVFLIEEMEAVLSPEESARRAAAYAELLALVLSDALDAGELTLEELRADPDLDRLWQEPAFRTAFAER